MYQKTHNSLTNQGVMCFFLWDIIFLILIYGQ